MSRLKFDVEKTSDCLDEVLGVLKKYRLGLNELLILYSNLGYTIGASALGYKGSGPGIEELKKMYFENPDLGVALMMAGLTMSTWYEDHEARSLEVFDKLKSKLNKKENKNENSDI